MRAEFLAVLGPSIKVVLTQSSLVTQHTLIQILEQETHLDSNATTHALVLSHGPKLLKGSRAIDGRLVRPRRLQDVVGAAVGLDRALFLRRRRRVVRAKRLDNVVLDQRVARPAVQRNVRVDALSVPRAAVLDDAL